MAQAEEQVDFPIRKGVTVYHGAGRFDEGSTVKLPKSHAEALDEYHARHDEVKLAASDGGGKKKTAAQISDPPPPAPQA